MGHYSVLKDGKTAVKYELTLNIKQQPQCTYTGEYDVTVNTNGGENVTTESLNISKYYIIYRINSHRALTFYYAVWSVNYISL